MIRNIVDKLFIVSKGTIYFIIAFYAFFQFVLSERNKISDVIDSNLLVYAVVAAALESLHNFFLFMTPKDN